MKNFNEKTKPNFLHKNRLKLVVLKLVTWLMKYLSNQSKNHCEASVKYPEWLGIIQKNPVVVSRFRSRLLNVLKQNN